MTHFPREGVNLTMEDALELSKSIQMFINNQPTLPDALKGYEVSMFNRAMQHAQEMFDNLNMMFSGERADGIVLQMQRGVLLESPK